MSQHQGAHESGPCLWCALLQIQRLAWSLHLDDLMGTPGRTMGGGRPIEGPLA